MEALPPHPYLQFLPETLVAVRRDIGLHKPGEMEEAVRILNEWVKQQKHFLKTDFSPVYLESTVVMCKGSLERSKVLLDNMCTLRTVMPHYFESCDVRSEFQRFKGTSYLVPLPQPTAQRRRVFVFKFAGKYDPGRLRSIYRYVYSSVDFVKLFDYHTGVEIIYDVSAVDVRDAVANVNLYELKNCYVSLSECYGARTKVIHLITGSKLIEKLIAFFRPFLKKKIMDRLVVHSSVDALHDYYPRELLPKDYGGTERSLDELQDQFLEVISSKEYTEHRKSMSDARIDVSLRPVAHFNDSCAGVNGSFRSLSLD